MAASHRSFATLLGVAVACFLCSTFGAASAGTTGPVTLDFTPLGSDRTADVSAGKAPADASFGHYEMSIIGIENAIRRYDGTTALDDGPIAYAVDAIRDWEHRFPSDPWIARDLFSLQRVYERVRTAQGFDFANRVARWLQTDYPQAQYASISGMELACVARGGCWQPPFQWHP
jgi:hypothetical protein